MEHSHQNEGLSRWQTTSSFDFTLALLLVHLECTNDQKNRKDLQIQGGDCPFLIRGGPIGPCALVAQMMTIARSSESFLIEL